MQNRFCPSAISHCKNCKDFCFNGIEIISQRSTGTNSINRCKQYVAEWEPGQQLLLTDIVHKWKIWIWTPIHLRGWQYQSIDSIVLNFQVRCSCSFFASGFRSSNNALPFIPQKTKVTGIGNIKSSDSCRRHEIIETWKFCGCTQILGSPDASYSFTSCSILR